MYLYVSLSTSVWDRHKGRRKKPALASVLSENIIYVTYILKGYDMNNYETTADLMENFHAASTDEAVEWDYYHKAIDSTGWTQYDYDHAEQNPFWLCEH
jgi:hypothetical protein